MKKVILCTLNSRYSHSSIALRFLYANLREIQDDAIILEFVINEDNEKIAEKILEHNPLIVGLGVYIWNVLDITQIIQIIKKVSPKTIIVLGGPEVSHTPMRVDLGYADFIIQGEGENSFYELCKNILDDNQCDSKIIKSTPVDFANIEHPYNFYTDHDIKNRHIYIEASRGCPFSCEFCLSSIDDKIRYLPIEFLINKLEKLWQRGARNFKFIDRTFNINISYGTKLLEYFLSKSEQYFVHFEVIPDNFPEEFKNLLSKFPPASLQLEIGIQTLNLEVAKNIKRNLRIDKIKHTSAHLHLDLIVGLPSETLQSFGNNLNTLVSLSSSEIQIGILKKLSGTTLSRHDEKFGMIYSDKPPYDILQNNLISFAKMQEMKRFARFWDIIYNSGNFKNTTKLLFENGDVFNSFLHISQYIYSHTNSTWKISFEKICDLLFDYLNENKTHNLNTIKHSLLSDIEKISGRTIPTYLRNTQTKITTIDTHQSSENKRQLKRIL